MKSFLRPFLRDDELVDGFGTIFKARGAGAHLARAVTAIVVFCALILMSPIRANAAGDLSLTGLFRHYPLSGLVEADAGYGVPLWGTPQTPFSGYVRPRVVFGTAAIYNSLDGAVEIYPIAFLGVRAGGESIQNDSKYSAYDCDRYRCMGHFYRTYFETELSVGAGPVFVQGRWRREKWSQGGGQTGDFIEPTSGLAMLGGGDDQTVVYGIAGYKINETWTAMGVLRYAESARPREISRSPIAMIRYTQGAWSVGVGAGTFESTLKKQGFTTQSFIRWEISPSLAIK